MADKFFILLELAPFPGVVKTSEGSICHNRIFNSTASATEWAQRCVDSAAEHGIYAQYRVIELNERQDGDI